MSFFSNKDAILKETQEKINKALEICGGMAESYAKADCPVDTGRLRNSITHAQTGDQEETIGSNVEYAPYVELGTSRMSARPFLAPAAEGHAAEYEAVIRKELSS